MITTRQCTCGNRLRYRLPARFDGHSLLIDIERCAVCPWCGQRLLVTAAVHRAHLEEQSTAIARTIPRDTQAPDLSLLATLRTVQGLLQIALQHLERVLVKMEG
jgi:hypothetical protein